MNHIVRLCLLFFVVNIAYGFNTLPSYIKPCSRSDPDFNVCALKNGQDAIKSIVDGDSTYHIPNFKPFKLDQIALEASKNIKLSGVNVEITGFEDGEIKNFNWDMDNQKLDIFLHFPVFKLLGTYKMDGKILIMVLKGTGPMNNTFYDNDVHAVVHYDLKTNEKNNYEYLYIDDVKVEMTIHDGGHLYFGNLLNNPQLSVQMNAFLNENWKVLVDEVISSVNEVLARVIKSVVNPIAAKIPFENVVKP